MIQNKNNLNFPELTIKYIIFRFLAVYKIISNKKLNKFIKNIRLSQYNQKLVLFFTYYFHKNHHQSNQMFKGTPYSNKIIKRRE